MNQNQLSFRQRVYNFFEHPKTIPAYLAQAIIISLIILSTIEFGIELFNYHFFETHRSIFHSIEVIMVVVFTVEYIIRFWAAPNRWKFFINFYSIIDLLAILPFYFLALNISFLRSAMILRVLRTLRLLRLAKIMKYSSGLTITHILQENIIKNLIVVIALVSTVHPIREFVGQVDSSFFADIMLAASILAVAAMFGAFGLNYESINPHKTFDRILTHVTSAALLFPIGVMFLIVQELLTTELNFFPTVMVAAIWFVYLAIVLWDFWNVKRVEEKIQTH